MSLGCFQYQVQGYSGPLTSSGMHFFVYYCGCYYSYYYWYATLAALIASYAAGAVESSWCSCSDSARMVPCRQFSFSKFMVNATLLLYIVANCFVLAASRGSSRRIRLSCIKSFATSSSGATAACTCFQGGKGRGGAYKPFAAGKGGNTVNIPQLQILRPLFLPMPHFRQFGREP